MKKGMMSLFALLVSGTVSAQTLEKMQWFNEPSQWEINDKKLTLFATPQSDYWRIAHYGFTVDDVKYPEVPGDRLMDINYTSGTTGFSKGVMITGNNICGNIVYGIKSGLCHSGFATQLCVTPFSSCQRTTYPHGHIV